MSQNIYDNPAFFREYCQLNRSVHGLAGAPEWPDLQALLPAMQGKRILDLGCGFGWFARWAREHGAQSVLAIDLSENMLRRAVEMTSDTNITYRKLNLEQCEFSEAAFDVAFSSLAVHYIQNLSGLFAAVHRSLAPGGHFVFSTEHPIYAAPQTREWLTQEDGNKIWPLDQYLCEGPRVTDWLAKGVVKHHRTIGTLVNLLIHCGFALEHLEEWGPSDAQLAEHPEWSEHRDRPMFLLLSARSNP